jgi:peroxiredoxin
MTFEHKEPEPRPVSKFRSFPVVIVAALAVCAGLAVCGYRLWPRAAGADAVAALLALSLPDAHGGEQALAQWKGRIIVVNYWATWCPPCRAEIGDFAAVSRDLAGKGVQFVGIGIDDAAKVREFGERFVVPYPLLVAPPRVLEQTAAFGNAAGALPLTVIIDRHGAVWHVGRGAMSRRELEARLRPLLGEMAGA